MSKPAVFPRWLTYGVIGFFAAGFAVALGGAVASLGDGAVLAGLGLVAASVVVILLHSPRLTGFSIGLKGMTATLDKVEQKVEAVDAKVDQIQALQFQMAARINQDLLVRRYEAYADLWGKLQSTAIYDPNGFEPKTAGDCSDELSKWYFSKPGGLLLTERAREFYFTLQRVLRKVGGEGALSGWTCPTRPEKPKDRFIQLLAGSLPAETVKGYLDNAEELDPEVWDKLCDSALVRLQDVVRAKPAAAGEDVFSVVQQAASVLRTNLTHDLGSRREVDNPSTRGQPPSTGG